MHPFWSSLTLLLPLNFKEVALQPRLGGWDPIDSIICEYVILWFPSDLYFFWNFWFIYECWDTICPDSVLSWFSAECWTAECSCGATLQYISSRARTRHSPPLSWARQWRGAAPVRDTTHYLTQDWNCFAADKLTQADHSIQYSIEQNFKSKMGSWGWQVED